MSNQETSKRGIWGSKIAFIFAAAGSAIGLGNVWRFPMLVGKNGGAIFVFVYILAVVLVGFAVMLSEFIIGRHSRKNPVGAFTYIKPRTPWKFIGYLGVFTGICILSYYSVIAGWATGYLVKTATGAFRGTVTSTLTEKIFSDFTTNPFQVILFLFLMIFLTCFIISKGVKAGIEKWSMILMPMLFLILVLLAIRALTLPGASKGVVFYLKPDFSKLNGTIFLFALGQAFFSLSLGMGTMITYGSYLSKKDNLVSSAGWVSFSDTFVAIMAGFIVFPTLFAFGLEPTIGPRLVFVVLPLIFPQLPGGQIFGSFFFVLLILAALTSTISLLEVPVAYLVDEKNWSRRKATWVLGLLAFILGIPSALSTGGMKLFTEINFLSWMDLIFGNISLLVGGLFICIFLSYVWGVKKAIEEVRFGNPDFKIKPLWIFSVKILSPLAILFILIFIRAITK